MPSFEYQALTTAGQSKKGFLEADSDRMARQALREEGLLPVSVTQASHTQATNTRAGFWQRGVAAPQIALFARQLATLIDSGIPVEEALHATAEQTRHTRLRKVILATRSRVREGHTLADALAEHPHIFSNIFRALVLAGEKSGDLGNVLNRLAEYLEDSQRLRSTLIQGMAYPIVLTLVAISVVAILMSYVVPKVVAQFEHVSQQLPLLTRILISCSEAIQTYGLYTLLALILAGFAGHQLLKNPARRHRWHRIQLKTPLLSRLIIATDSARLLRTLHILTGSGLPLLDAVRVARNTLSNLQLKAALDVVIERVEAGSTLNRALSEQQLFPPIAIYMIANGEKTGELDRMLDKAASTQEQQLTTTFSLFVTLFEPALIILLGGVVLLIVLAILLPILQLNNLSPL
ncbi:MAG: type II secretion system inner membrane protein GspF [Pontibacterium sp.]